MVHVRNHPDRWRPLWLKQSWGFLAFLIYTLDQNSLMFVAFWYSYMTPQNSIAWIIIPLVVSDLAKKQYIKVLTNMALIRMSLHWLIILYKIPRINIYAKWCNLSKYTNPDCCALLKCRLHWFYEEKLFIWGVLYRSPYFKRLWRPGIDSKEWIPPAYVCSLAGRYDNPIPARFLAPIDFLNFQLRAIFNLLFYMSSSIEILQEKKSGCFVSGIYLWRVISYYLIDQSRIYKGHFDLGYSDQDCFRRANRSIEKNQGGFWFRLSWYRTVKYKMKSKTGMKLLSTQGILITREVIDLGYSVLASYV
jgi:hypothetical protein